MASKRHKTAKGKRDTASKERKSLVKERKDARKGGASKADIAKITSKIMNKSGEMRIAGDTMREETGREKGQRTTYTGPAKQATIDLIKKTTGQTLPEETKWQQVNAAWQNELMKSKSEGGLGLTRAQARTRLKTLFAKNRSRYLEEQQQRYDDNIVAPVLDTDIDLDLDLDDDSKTKVVPKITGGSEYLATDYDRPGLLDWSDLEPPDMPGLLGSAKAQQDLLGSGLAAYQPWAQPAIEYQPPVGPTYATRASLLGGASPSVSGAGDDVITPKDNGNGYTGPLGQSWDNYQDWYINSPNNAAVGTNQAAAMSRLYNAAGGDPVWGNVSYRGYAPGQQSWFQGPRGSTSKTGGILNPYLFGGPDGTNLTYEQIMGGETK